MMIKMRLGVVGALTSVAILCAATHAPARGANDLLPGTYVWTDSVQDARCPLTFAPLAGAMLQLTQDVRFGDCGFGYGVLADGLYQRTKPTGRLGNWNGP